MPSATSRYCGKLINTMLSSMMGIPTDPEYDDVFIAQVMLETGDATQLYWNNPLNLRPSPTGKWDGEIGVSPANFSKFDTLEHGCKAASLNYYNGSSYSVIRQLMMQQAIGVNVATAIEDSPWDAGHYGHGNLQRKYLEISGDIMDKREYETQIEDYVKDDIRLLANKEPQNIIASLRAMTDEQKKEAYVALFSGWHNEGGAELPLLLQSNEKRTIVKIGFPDGSTKIYVAVEPV